MSTSLSAAYVLPFRRTQAGVSNFRWRFPLLADEMLRRREVERALAALPTERLRQGVEHMHRHEAIYAKLPTPVSFTQARVHDAPHSSIASAAATAGELAPIDVKPPTAARHQHNVTKVVLELMDAGSSGAPAEGGVNGSVDAQLDNTPLPSAKRFRGASRGALTIPPRSPSSARASQRQRGAASVAALLRNHSSGTRRRPRGLVASFLAYLWGSPLSIIAAALAVGFLAFAVFYVILFGLRRPGNEVR